MDMDKVTNENEIVNSHFAIILFPSINFKIYYEKD